MLWISRTMGLPGHCFGPKPDKPGVIRMLTLMSSSPTPLVPRNLCRTHSYAVQLGLGFLFCWGHNTNWSLHRTQQEKVTKCGFQSQRVELCKGEMWDLKENCKWGKGAEKYLLGDGTSAKQIKTFIETTIFTKLFSIFPITIIETFFPHG